MTFDQLQSHNGAVLENVPTSTTVKAFFSTLAWLPTFVLAEHAGEER